MEVIKIPNIANYSWDVFGGVLVLTPKKWNLNEEELYRTTLSKSKIMECNVSKEGFIISNETKYLPIVKDIWKTMPREKISEKTTFNLKDTNERGISGYDWDKNLRFSIQTRC